MAFARFQPILLLSWSAVLLPIACGGKDSAHGDSRQEGETGEGGEGGEGGAVDGGGDGKNGEDGADGGASMGLPGVGGINEGTGGTPIVISPPPPNCGDGVVDTDEQCDDGGESSDCNFNCTISACGDGIANSLAGEDCDEAGVHSTCDEDCSWPECGDGEFNSLANEECDDGNTTSNDGCSEICLLETVYCGNGAVEPGEGCDEAGETARCTDACTVSRCGDQLVNATAGETCDDGNQIGGDGCDPYCKTEPPSTCGDGESEGVENCDDSGESFTCDADCTASLCGDGTTNSTAGEACDAGEQTVTCDLDCSIPSCGDGELNGQAGEQCDDGNDAVDDGCNACQVEIPEGCGDGITSFSEECDDEGESDYCDVDCTFLSCGDGVLNLSAGEECDDSNLLPNDGCSADCTLEDHCGDGVCSSDLGESCATCAADCSCSAGQPCTSDSDCAGPLICDPGTYQCAATPTTNAPTIPGLNCVVTVEPLDPDAEWVDDGNGNRTVNGGVLLRSPVADIPFPAPVFSISDDGSMSASTEQMLDLSASGSAFAEGVTFDGALSVILNVTDGDNVRGAIGNDLVPVDRSYIQFQIIDTQEYAVNFGSSSGDPEDGTTIAFGGDNPRFQYFTDPCEPLWVQFGPGGGEGWSTAGVLEYTSAARLWDGTTELNRTIYGHQFREIELPSMVLAGIPASTSGTVLVDFDARDDGGLVDGLVLDKFFAGSLVNGDLLDAPQNQSDLATMINGDIALELPLEGSPAVSTLGETIVLDFDDLGGVSGGTLHATVEPGATEILFGGESQNPFGETQLADWFPVPREALRGYARAEDDWGFKSTSEMQFFPQYGGPTMEAERVLAVDGSEVTLTASGEVEIGNVEIGGMSVPLGSLNLVFEFDFAEEKFCAETTTDYAEAGCVIEICAALGASFFETSALCDGCSAHSECGTNFCSALGTCETPKANGAFCLNNQECASTHCAGGACVECETDEDCADGVCDIGGDKTCKTQCATTVDCDESTEWCNKSKLMCEAKKPLGASCPGIDQQLQNEQCTSDRCNGECVQCLDDVDCAEEGDICDNTPVLGSFACEKACNAQTDCPDTEFCDTIVSQTCTPDFTLHDICSFEEQCGDGTHCTGLTCEECAADEHCGGGWACDTREVIGTFTCHEPCNVDGDCSADQYCSSEGKCTEDRTRGDLCDRHAQCLDGQFQCALGVCQLCADDSVCADDEYCDNFPGFGSFRCTPDKGLNDLCDRDEQCAFESLYCTRSVAGACKECTEDSHCSGGQVCDNSPVHGSFECIAPCSADTDCDDTQYCSVLGKCTADRGLDDGCDRDEMCLSQTYYCTSPVAGACKECTEDSHCKVDGESCHEGIGGDLTCRTECTEDDDCDASEWCDESLGLCLDDREREDFCSRDEMCTDGELFCVQTAPPISTCQECGQDSHCTGPGETCGGVLADYTCGVPCQDGDDCDASEWCDVDGQCKPDLGLGEGLCTLRGDDMCLDPYKCTALGSCEECAEHGDCDENQWCDEGVGYTCEPDRGTSGLCTSDEMCAGSLKCTVAGCQECGNDDHCAGADDVCDLSSFTCREGCSNHSDCDKEEEHCSLGVCVPDLEIGGVCVTSPEVCLSGVCATTCVECVDAGDCGTNEDCHANECGTACDDDNDCDDAEYCNGTICVDDLSLGALCDRNEVCDTNACASGLCRECVNDDPCTNPDEYCETGFFGSYTCKDPCQADNECDEEQYCNLGECVDDLLLDEGLCSGDSQCEGSAVCAAGYCQECRDEDQCQAGEYCDNRALLGSFECEDQLAIDDSCAGDQFCQSGHCTGGAVIPGVCAECTADSHCDEGANEVCDSFFGSNTCKFRCEDNGDCPGGWCNFFSGRCELAKPIGEPCLDNDECQDGNCAAGACRECDENTNFGEEDCGAGQWCELAAVDSTLYTCQDDFANETGCTSDAQCLSDHCSLFTCVECENNGHCGSNEFCSGNECVPLLDYGDTCGVDTECASGYCDAFTCVECENGGHCSGNEVCSLGQCKYELLSVHVDYCWDILGNGDSGSKTRIQLLDSNKNPIGSYKDYSFDGGVCGDSTTMSFDATGAKYLRLTARGSDALVLDNIGVKMTGDLVVDWLWADGGGFNCISTDTDDRFDATPWNPLDNSWEYCVTYQDVTLP